MWRCTLLLVLLGFAAWSECAPTLPKTFLLNAKTLVASKAQIANNDPNYITPYKDLIARADFCLKQGPFSVMMKTGIAPSNDKHDYYSISTYWWPCNWDPKNVSKDCNTTTGVPWVRRDGEENPDRASGDSYPLGYMATNVTELALAYYFSGQEKYAAAAAGLLKAWFLNASTMMNPNMVYAQIVPGQPLGKSTDGIIDARYFIDSGGTVDPFSYYKTIGGVVEAAPLLEGSVSWTDADNDALKDWFKKYLSWLTTSDQGLHSKSEPNNHGSWYDVQVLAYAYYVGDNKTAAAISYNATKRVITQVEPNGTLPLELARTKGFWYCFFALGALWDEADLALYSGVDIWHFNSTDGRNIRHALDYLVPFITGEQEWPYSQIIFFDRGAFFPILRRAANEYNSATYEKHIDKLPKPRSYYMLEVSNLLYPRRYF